MFRYLGFDWIEERFYHGEHPIVPEINELVGWPVNLPQEGLKGKVISNDRLTITIKFYGLWHRLFLKLGIRQVGD